MSQKADADIRRQNARDSAMSVLISGTLALGITFLTGGGIALAQKSRSKSQVASCAVMTVTPAGRLMDKLPEDAPEVAGFTDIVEQVSRSVRNSDAETLVKLFHPRLKMDKASVQSRLAEIHARYVDPVDISPLKLMWLDTVSGLPGHVDCDFDGASVKPLHGYRYQGSLWLQATGQRDIARLMIAVVPVPKYLGGGWRIGSFHVQQWTHAGKDPLTWLESARKSAVAKQDFLAWAEFDIAAKLLKDNQIVSYAAYLPVIADRDRVISQAGLRSKIGKMTGGLAVEEVASLLALDGAGLLVKLRLVKELSTNDIQKNCNGVVKNLAESGAAKGLSGVRCMYYRPGESLAKDGITGGIFIKSR